MLSALRLSIATTQISADMSITNQRSNRTLIMSIIFMSVLAALVLVAQPTLAGSGGGGSGSSGSDGDSGDENQNAPNTTSDNMRHAIKFIAQKDFERAIESLNKEINANPENPAPWVKLGSIVEAAVVDNDEWMSSGAFHTFEEPFEKAMVVMGEEKNFAEYLYYVTKLGTAQMFFQQALKVKPKDTNALTELAYNHLSQHVAALQRKGKLHDYDKTPHVIKALKIAYDLKAACKINCGYVTKLFAEANRVDAEKLKP